MGLFLKKYVSFYLLSLVTIVSFTSCSRDNTDPSLDYQEDTQVLESVSKAKNVASQSVNLKIASKSDFEKELQKYKVTFTSKDYDMVRTMIRVKPLGQWTPGPENDSKANQKKHFLKHGGDFKPAFKNEVDYLNSAVAVFNSKSPTSNFYVDLNSYKESKIVSVVKWDSKTYDFTVVRANGQTATYFLNNRLKSDRFIFVPNDLK